MRWSAMLAVAMVVMMVGAGTAKASADDDVKTQIGALERKCLSYMDIDQKMSCYSSSDDLVIFGLTNPESAVYGAKAVRAFFERMLTLISDPTFEIINLEIIPDGDLAVAIMTQHATATLQGGRHIDTSFRVTEVWRKEAGGWKIVHAHSSYPIDPNTGAPNIHVQ
jgi:ketosteroid isomerase-like protein